MNRIFAGGLIPCIFIAATTLPGQTREAYEQAYQIWRQSDPNLERDAGKAGAALSPRTDKVAADAAKFVTARKAFYDAEREELSAMLDSWELFQLPAEMQAAKTVETYLSAQETTVGKSIEAFSSDPDRGIQQLRQALEKERAALGALRSAMEARATATDAARQADESAGRARDSAADPIKLIVASLEQSERSASQLAEAWPSYYHALATGARGVEIGNGPSPTMRPRDSAPTVTPSIPGSSNRVAPGVPISRYTGSWNFLFGVSTYKGLSPVSFDVDASEEGGQIHGTVDARFIVAGNADPSVRFVFSGPLEAARNQAFPLQTPEGAKGTIELIPGSAFNLLEVKFTLEGAPGKVGESDVILVKR